MRSRPVRLTLSALAWIALGAAALFSFQTQQQLDARRTALRTFEATARDATDALDDLQAGQQAYVIPGQDAAEWVPKVAAYRQTAASSIDTLRASAMSAAGGPSLLEASAMVNQLATIDARVRESLESGDQQAAAASIFAEGADAVASAISNIDTARAAEQQATDDEESRLRLAMLYALGGAAGLSAFVLAVLGFVTPTARDETGQTGDGADATPSDEGGLSLTEARTEAGVEPAAVPELDGGAPLVPDSSREALASAAALCTAFGRVREAGDLKDLLERTAGAMNARGLIVWLGNADGADLHPVLAFGYSDQTLARIPTVARSADNAAAAAYRTSEVQIVRSRPGASQGAVVAPLLVADGCIGALTAEVRDRGEDSDAVRALASIVASQLASVLSTAAAEQAVPASHAESAAG